MAARQNLTGPEKAAILLMSIGEDNAGQVMSNMGKNVKYKRLVIT